MAGRSILWSVGQVHALAEACTQRHGRQRPGPRRGQLDRQRQSLELGTDPGDGACIGLVKRKGGTRGAGPLDEQGYARHGGERIEVDLAVDGRHRQRLDLHHVFPAQPQGLATGRQHRGP
jgi:hypothetical protein